MHNPVFKLILTLVFGAALIVSGVQMVGIMRTMKSAVTDFQSPYSHAPNCGEGGDPDRIDPSLPPCTYEPAKITAKTVTRDWMPSRHATPVERYADLLGPSGRTETVGSFDQANWDQLQVGDEVQVQRWQGQIYQVSDKGMNQLIFESRLGLHDNAVALWLFLFFGSLAGLRIVWYRRNRAPAFWLPR